MADRFASLKPAVTKADDAPTRRLLHATEGRDRDRHASHRFLEPVKVETHPAGQAGRLLELFGGLLPHCLEQRGEAQFRRFFSTP